MYSHGIWKQWSLGRVTHETSTDMRILYPLICIFVGIGHNDPWVESHMWPQQTWGRMSSWGQWPLVQVFEKKGHWLSSNLSWFASLNNKALGNLFCNPQRSFHTSPEHSDSNNSIYKIKLRLGVKFLVNAIVEFEEWLTTSIIRVGEVWKLDYKMNYENLCYSLRKIWTDPVGQFNSYILS